MATPQPILLTPEEAAKALRIGRTRLYALLADGTIRSVRIGHSRRISIGALEDFVRRLHGSTRDAEQAVTDQRHDGQRHPTHRSRRRKPPRPPQAELLPLPFPQSTEER